MMSQSTVRVLVVDDSRSARALIRALIEASPGLTVCGEAENGREAVAKTMALSPDIVTMDLQMPEMDGMRAIEEIMARHAVPILVLSDLADAHNAMAAVARGALEAAGKPSFDEGAGLVARLRTLAKVRVIRHIRCGGALVPRLGAHAWPGPIPIDAKSVAGAVLPALVAIASSTGGPQALARLLPALPEDFPAPVLIAQHISDGFATAMAEWLNDLCPLQVTLAREGETPRPGCVYLADSLTDMTLGAGGRIRLLSRAATDFYRPSCDRLLTSVAAQHGARAVAVILTGMGRDGANGMVAVRRAGGATIAQDEASSLIFGMNREAIRVGGVQWVLPLDLIAGELLALTAPRRAAAACTP